jgi:hypothetical protein
VKKIRQRLTYANVMSSIAVFLVLGGATAIAAKKIGSHQLKANSVTTAKIKKNAVTTAKIKNKAVNFTKIAAGTNVIATATGGPIAANNETPTTIPLTGTTSFTPQAGVVDFLSVELKGDNLARAGEKPCTPTVQPYVNGNSFEVAQGFLTVRAIAPTEEEPSGLRPVSSETGPLGVLSPAVAQAISAKLFGDKDCTATSTVSVAIVVTQAK